MDLPARLLVALAVVVLGAGCSGSDDDPGPSSRPSASAGATSPDPAPETPAPVVPTPAEGGVDLTDGGASPGATIGSAEDLARLDDTSPEFRAFVDRVLGGLSTGECDQAPTVTVSAFDPRGFAVGGVNACGGYRAYWVGAGGWAEIAGTQSVPPCEALEAVGFPRGLVGGTCVDGSGRERAYAGPA